MKKQLLILFALFIALIGYSQASFTENYITYQVLTTDPTAVGISGYDIAGGANVVIPATVTDSNINTTYNVKVIGQAFFGVPITSVVIPDGVTTISLNAFFNSQLSSVTIPSSVVSIAGNAFNIALLECVNMQGSTPPTISNGAGGTSDTFGGNRSDIDLVVPQNRLSQYANAGWTGFNSASEVLELNDTFVIDNITYRVASSSAYIVKTIDYNMAGGSVVNIPATVTTNCTVYDVTEIGQLSFSQKQLTSVTIPNSVTTIAGSAFRDNNLTNVVIPNSVTSIFSSVFEDNNLSSIVIPNSVTSIGNQVFKGNNISNVTFSNNMSSIPLGTFQANNFSSITIPDNITSIGNSAFSGNTSLTNVNLSTNLNSIGYAAFNNCSLTNVNIPNSVDTIGNLAFSNNNTITSLSLPFGVISIGDYAFQDNQLTNVTIPATVTSIGAGAFRSNPLTSVTSLATTPASITTENGNNDTFVQGGDRSGIALYIPASTTDIYVTNPNAGADWSGFNPVTELPAVGGTLVEDYISYEVTSTALNTVEVTGYDVLGGTVVNIPAIITHNTIDYDVTRIDNQAFQGKGLTAVTIPNSITEIGSYAFFQNSITEIVIPDSITNIELGIFETNLLTSVTIPENIASISIGSFKNNPLNSVISKSVTPPTIVTGGNTDSFNSNRTTINLIIPNNTTDEYVTDNGAIWTGFKIIHEIIPSTNTLKVVDYNSASGTTVSIPATITDGSVTYNVTEIGISAFFDKGLTSVTIPNSITTIGTSAFNTNNLASVTIPDSVLIIGSQAFVTNDLTSLSIGNNVTEIGFGAFADNDLTDITIPSSVTNIGLVAFAANPLTDVTSLAIVPPTITTGTNDTFEITGDRSNIHLHIPAGTLGAYVTDPGALWTGFNPVTEDALSVSDFELANSIKIITTTDAIKIISADSVRLENYTIYSISGAKISTGIESQISTTSLANGIYILKLDFDKGSVTKKVIVN